MLRVQMSARLRVCEKMRIAPAHLFAHAARASFKRARLKTRPSQSVAFNAISAP